MRKNYRERLGRMNKPGSERKIMNYLRGFNLLPFFDAPGERGGGGGGEPTPSPNPPRMSFDDFLKDKDNQAEFDRRMQKGIKTALDNERQRLEAIADEKISEAEKLNKMTDLERKEYQQKKEAEKIAQREKDITRRELMAEAKNTLGDKKLPISLAEILDYSDAEKCNSSLATVEKAFNEAVEAGVNEKLKGGKPPKDVPPGNTLEEIEKEILGYMKG